MQVSKNYEKVEKGHVALSKLINLYFLFFFLFVKSLLISN